MTNGPTTPPASATGAASSLLVQPSPALRLGSRRPSNTKVGSRAPSEAVACSGEGTPATPVYTSVAPTPRVVTPPSEKAPTEGAAVAAAPVEAAASVEASSPARASKAPAALCPKKVAKSGAKRSASATPSAVPSEAATPKGRSRSASQVSVKSTKSNKSVKSSASAKELKSLSPKFSGNVSLSATPLVYRARAGVQDDGEVPAAGIRYTSRYAVPKCSLRTIDGKSQVATDIHSLSPLPEDHQSPRSRNKRVMFAAYAPTAVAYSDEESRQHQAEERLLGKRCNGPRSLLAPWERTHPSGASPKRAGSARPPVRTAATPPWAKEDDGFSHNRSVRSHSAGAIFRTTASPYGVTEGSHSVAFAKGDTKVIESSRGEGARPTTGKCTRSAPADHDILNPDAPLDKVAPSGRRAPPASAIAPSEEYVRPLSRKPVEQIEHVDRPVGKQCSAMATAACEGSPFRTARDDLRAAGLSPEQSVMGSQSPRRSASARPPTSRVLVEGRSCGVQSYHIDPSNPLGSTSAFSPPRERHPTAKKGFANHESEPGSDIYSKQTVCPVRAGRNKESLVGVMYPAPQRPLPAYEVVAPYWTATTSE